MGLKDAPHYSCLLSGILETPNSHKNIAEYQSQLHVGLYVENFIFYSSDPAQEALFQTLIQEHIQTDFMGYVDYLLLHLLVLKKKTGKSPSIYTNRNELNSHPIGSQFKVQTRFPPYCSGFPIDSIPPVDPLDPDLPR